MMKAVGCLVLALTACGTLFSPIYGGEENSNISLMEAPVSSSSPEKEWEFLLTPYLWTAGLNGVVGEGGILSPADIGFDDILDDLDLALLLGAEVRRGRWGLLSVLTWLDLSSSQGGGGAYYNSANLEMTQTVLDARITYRLHEGRTVAELMAGVRYFDLDTEVLFYGGQLGGTGLVGDDNWVDPLVGLRLTHQFTDRWLGVLRGDIGGFGVSSDLAWEVFGGIGYQVTDSILLFGGYRHLDIDYDRRVTFNASMSGALFGARFQF